VHNFIASDTPISKLKRTAKNLFSEKYARKKQPGMVALCAEQGDDFLDFVTQRGNIQHCSL
jgi:hypothetical protein